jgi:hypothetical protein
VDLKSWSADDPGAGLAFPGNFYFLTVPEFLLLKNIGQECCPSEKKGAAAHVSQMEPEETVTTA